MDLQALELDAIDQMKVVFEDDAVEFLRFKLQNRIGTQLFHKV